MKKRAPYVWEPSACHQNQSTGSTGSPAWTKSSPRQSLRSPGSALSGPLAFSFSRYQPNCVGRRRRDSLSEAFPGKRLTISSDPPASQPGQNKILKWGRNRRQNAIRDGGSTALFKRDGQNLDADNFLQPLSGQYQMRIKTNPDNNSADRYQLFTLFTLCSVHFLHCVYWLNCFHCCYFLYCFNSFGAKKHFAYIHDMAL